MTTIGSKSCDWFSNFPDYPRMEVSLFLITIWQSPAEAYHFDDQLNNRMPRVNNVAASTCSPPTSLLFAPTSHLTKIPWVEDFVRSLIPKLEHCIYADVSSPRMQYHEGISPYYALCRTITWQDEGELMRSDQRQTPHQEQMQSQVSNSPPKKTWINPGMAFVQRGASSNRHKGNKMWTETSF